MHGARAQIVLQLIYAITVDFVSQVRYTTRTRQPAPFSTHTLPIPVPARDVPLAPLQVPSATDGKGDDKQKQDGRRRGSIGYLEVGEAATALCLVRAGRFTFARFLSFLQSVIGLGKEADQKINATYDT